MKKKTLFQIIFLTILFNNKLFSQTNNWECGSNLLLNTNVQADTSVQGSFSRYMHAIINSTSLPAAPSTPYIIPVVFHVIQDANNTTPIPSYDQIKWQLATLNAAFSNSLSTLNNQLVGPRANNTSIQFCLAKQVQTTTTPTAWPTSSLGVIYYSTGTSSITNAIVSGSLAGSSLNSLGVLTSYGLGFPSNMYLNIWCVPNITTLNSGYSVFDTPSIIGMGTFPWMNFPIDGIIMRNDAIGNNNYNNSFNMYPNSDKGMILAHEAGHYFGLLHTFDKIIGSSLVNTSTLGCNGTMSRPKIG